MTPLYYPCGPISSTLSAVNIEARGLSLFPIPCLPLILHSLILLRVFPLRLIPHLNLGLVPLVVRPRFLPLLIEQIDCLLR